jgi:hypothetical protein
MPCLAVRLRFYQMLISKVRGLVDDKKHNYADEDDEDGVDDRDEIG